jgi:hypothetical protein
VAKSVRARGGAWVREEEDKLQARRVYDREGEEEEEERRLRRGWTPATASARALKEDLR